MEVTQKNINRKWRNLIMTNNNNENTQGNMNQNIGDLFNDHFYKQIKNVKENGQTLSTSLKVLGLEKGATVEQKNVANHFKSIMKRYSVALEYFTSEDMVQSYALLFVQAAYQLEVLEPLRILKSDAETYKIRLGFIKQYIDREFVTIVNPSKQAVKTKDGRKYIEVKEELILDAPMNAENPEGSSRLDYIKEEDNIFKAKSSTPNHFIAYVLLNHSDILTKKQDEIFVKLLDCYAPLTDRSAETLERRKAMIDEIGISNTHIDRTFKAIKKRCVTAYNKEFGGMTSHVTEQSKKFHEVLNSYVESANNPNWKTPQLRQEQLTEIIVSNYENETFETLIIENLKVDEVKNIVRAYNGKELISHTVLRKIGDNIKKYIKMYAPIEVEASYPEFDYKENFFDGLANLPTKGARLKANGTIEYQDTETGEWKKFG